jgi:hypothetical protein
MSGFLSHPLDPHGARVLVPAGNPGSAPFALRSASTIAWGSGWSVGTQPPLVYGLPRPARGSTPRERRFHPRRGVSLRVFRRRVRTALDARQHGCRPYRTDARLYIAARVNRCRRAMQLALSPRASTGSRPYSRQHSPIYARGTCWTEPVPPSSVQPIFQACAQLKRRRAGRSNPNAAPSARPLSFDEDHRLARS